MHVITLLGAVATAAVVRNAMQRRVADATGRPFVAGPLVGRLASVILLVGVLAFVDGCVQMLQALRSVSADQQWAAAARAGQIVPIPFAWSLIVAAILLFVDGMMGAFRRPGLPAIGG